MKVGPSVPVVGTSVPSQSETVKGRSGSASVSAAAKGGGVGHAFDASASGVDEGAPLGVPAPQPVGGAQVHAAEPAVEAVERHAVGAAGEHVGAGVGERERRR